MPAEASSPVGDRRPGRGRCKLTPAELGHVEGGPGVENLKKAKAASLPLPFVAALPLAALLAEPEPGQEGAAFPEDMRPRHCPVALL